MPAGDLGVDDRSTGFEVCRRIKRDPRTARIPVIFVTALNDTTDRVKAIEAGGDDFLTKPHNRLVLGARVRSLLKLKAATDALEDSYRKLRELEKVRDDLMKMIVHDLKTPLTSVLATLEMLADGDFGAGDRRAAGRAARHREQGGGAAAPHRGPPRGGADRGDVDRARPRAARAGDVRAARSCTIGRCGCSRNARTTTVEVARDVPGVLAATASLLKRVFGNLIQNSLVHSSRAVELRLFARTRAARRAVHRRRQRPGHPAAVPRGDLPQVRAREDA